MRGAGRQAGGTFLGLIIGLILGLGIALAVAVVVTKTPVPFLNKLGKQDKPPELTPSQAADPNKPLYGNKEPAKEAAKEFANEPEQEPAQAESGVEGSKLPVKPTADKPKSADKPDGKLVTGAPMPGKTADGKSSEGSPVAGKDGRTVTPKSESAEEKWVYYLQAGAFREQSDADSAKAKLALAGFEASISERSAESGSLYRVRIGPFNQVEAMNRARVKLSDNGMDVAVIRIAK
jgi:cell division protein FtsN